MTEQQNTQAEELAGMQSGTVVYGGSRQPRTLFRLHGTGRHWIGEHGERYTDAEAAEELGEFESEHPVPTTDEPRRVLMTHPHDGHGPDDTCLDCETKTSPHPPTRERIAEALWRADLNPQTEVTWTGTPPWMVEHYLSRADAVLALIQNGADR